MGHKVAYLHRQFVVLLVQILEHQDGVAHLPNDANAHNNLAHTLLALQRYDEALVSARAALKINPMLVQARAHEQQALAGLKEKAACVN